MATFLGNGLQSASVGRLWSYVNSELSRRAVVENFFAKRENNLLERHRWQFLTSDPLFKEYMSLQYQGNHELKVDIFEVEDSKRKGFFALYMDAACKLSSCSCFLEGNPRQRFEPNGATLISHLAKDWMQHFHQFQFLISDPSRCFVSNELRECASVRGIGLLTAPGEFHGLAADLENLIRVIKRLARKLADDHPSLTLACCVSLACFSHNNGFKTGGYSPVQWAFSADNEGTVSQRRCPLRLRLSGCPR